VAIAISLVPPLTVIGLTLDAGRNDQARGALLLFLTNVAAILVTGVIVMTMYRVRRTALAHPPPHATRTVGSRYPVIVIVAFVVIVAIPLVISGQRYATSTLTTDHVAKIAAQWGAARNWEVVSADYREGDVVVRMAGPEPAPDPAKLRQMLDAGGERGTGVSLELVPQQRVNLPAG
jgi:amino acid transporter